MFLAIYLTLYNNAVRPVKRKGWHFTHMTSSFHSVQRRIQDFKLGGGALIKNCAERRREHFWGISCEKITILCQKIIFFPILGGARDGCAPHGSAPGMVVGFITTYVISAYHH